MLSLVLGSDFMFYFIINKFKNMDIHVKNIMHYGFVFSLLFCMISILVLFTYHAIYHLPLIFSVGTILFKSSLMFFVDFIICGVAFDTIRKQQI